ncbi:ABC transporter ATP-binding protein [Psychrosphaera aquimarina]|uniref:ABC transporter ATP-binding protein n=1 Tax=Psychrosphaera aquimarina TaxID=2044854 RepID=A0ABU3R196_9GAMM|nr:ABC transporter ATP-binding protein [Psychrosphaera aquimarina]MDU0113448.1 ABC transporter ATP-binding protein [Psychrosphaera aquimarina]
MLTIKNLSKQYNNGVHALDDINLTIGKGMFGLLGPNGAGKSSLMRTLATLQLPDSGSITFDGIDVLTQPNKIKQVLGYLPQDFGVYPRVSAYELLDYLAIMKGLTNPKVRKEQVLALLQQTNLYEHRHNYVANFSGGMKRRFGIAQSLLADPKLIMVDEPTAGLDPEERNRFYNLLSEVGKNIILILSTHIIEDIQDLCTDMAIINRGQVLKQGSPKALMAELQGQVWCKQSGNLNLKQLAAQHQILSTKSNGAQKAVHVHSQHQPDSDFTLVEPSLEDAYFKALNSEKAISSASNNQE